MEQQEPQAPQSDSNHIQDRMLFLPKEHVEGAPKRNAANALASVAGLVIGFAGMHYLKNASLLKEIPLTEKASAFIAGPTTILVIALGGIRERIQKELSDKKDDISISLKLSLLSILSKSQLLLIATNFGAGINCFLK